MTEKKYIYLAVEVNFLINRLTISTIKDVTDNNLEETIESIKKLKKDFNLFVEKFNLCNTLTDEDIKSLKEFHKQTKFYLNWYNKFNKNSGSIKENFNNFNNLEKYLQQ